MAEILIKLGEQLNSSVFVLLALLVATGYGLMKIGAWSERFLHLNQKVDGALSMEKTVIRLEQLTELIDNNTLKKPLIQGRSPLSLTSTGVQASQRIGLASVLSREFPKLSAWVEQKASLHAYDVQVASMCVARESFPDLLTPDEMSQAKSFAYEQGIRLEDLSAIFGVLLRDEILKQKKATLSPQP